MHSLQTQESKPLFLHHPNPTISIMTQATHLAAVLRGAKTLAFEEIETPALQPHEVSIVPRATGLCGTDLHYYQNGRNGIYTVKNPLVLGHEASGEVIAVGSLVTEFKPGDRIVFEPQSSCQSCKQCRSGRYNLCKRMRFNGSASADPPAQGSLQKVLNHPASLVYRLPESLSFSEGAMVEPLSVALHSVRKGRLEAGQTALVTGAGAVGLLCARIAKISGASSIIMVDVDANRLRFAKQHGFADKIVLIPMNKEEAESTGDFSTRMARLVVKEHGVEADLALECTGVESCLNICIGSVAAGSRVVLVGMGTPRQEVNLGLALVKEVELIGIWRYTHTFQPAIDLIAAGMVDVKPMISHTYDLEQVADALEFALSRPVNLVKCIVTSDR